MNKSPFYKEQLDLLMDKYNKPTLSRYETAEAIGIAVSTLDLRVKRCEDAPRYKRLGNTPKARVLFPTIEVAKYLCRDLVEIA